LIAGENWSDALKVFLNPEWPDPILAIANERWHLRSPDSISSSGFVVHTLESAIWAVETTDSFEEAVLRAVNLGDDADSVGAVAGQFAGARYGLSAIPARWRDGVAQSARIVRIAEALVAAGSFSRKSF
jgi:ADP-ribosyl-[dinitrogen reductase] hydrolase